MNQREALEGAGPYSRLLDASFWFGSWDGYVRVIERTVPLPDDVSVAEFLSCVDCYLDDEGDDFGDGPDGGADVDGGAPAAGGGILDFDREAFLVALDREVIEPVRQTQALFGGDRQVTRLYTTLSADEMNVDPEFDYNPDLDDVSNVHDLTIHELCSDGDGPRWWAELDSGLVVWGSELSTWPIAPGDDLPYNLRVLQDSTSGDGEVVTDNRDAVADALALLGVGGTRLPQDIQDMVDQNGGDGDGDGDGDGPGGFARDPGMQGGSNGCGCSLPGKSGSSLPAGLAAFSLLSLFALRRRFIGA
jgi:MYXO-CTERM domain-containing protein